MYKSKWEKFLDWNMYAMLWVMIGVFWFGVVYCTYKLITVYT